VKAGDQSQSEVVEVYNIRIAELTALRENWEYMTSKHLCDSALLADAGLSDAEVLNVGCFFPLDEIALVHRVKHWTATDLGESTIRFAEEAAQAELHPDLFSRLSFEVADGTALQYEDASFDVVVSLSTVDHVVSPEGRERFVREMARVTRPGGRVVITVPNRWNRGYAQRERLYGAKTEFFEHCFSPLELRRIATGAGLRVTRMTSTAEVPVLAPRAFLPRLDPRRPVLSTYNRVARFLGSRMGLLAVKP
jgi:SAM-dependent methyltransferase